MRPDSKLPEALTADGARLASVHDDADRISLTATMLFLLRQVIECAHRLARLPGTHTRFVYFVSF